MDLIEKYDKVVKDINEIIMKDEIDAKIFEMSIININKIINIYTSVSNNRFEVQKDLNNFKLKFINNELLDDDKKINAILLWKMNNYLPNNKEIVLKYINSSNPNYFNSLWTSIKSNNIKLNRNDIKQINNEFINYCLNSTNKYNILNKKNETDETNEYSDDYEEDNIKVNPIEMFFVNIIMENENIDIINKSLECLVVHTNLKLNLFPSGRVQKFNGNLLPQLINYYNLNYISPLIKYRRSLGIIFENSSFHYYDYVSYLEANNGIINADNISIEFPYLCYVYFEKLEIDFIPKYYTTKEIKINAHSGYDYLLKPMRKIQKISNENTIKNKDIITHTVINLNKDDPCVYIKISLNDIVGFDIYDIRIYGEAISLI